MCLAGGHESWKWILVGFAAFNAEGFSWGDPYQHGSRPDNRTDSALVPQTTPVLSTGSHHEKSFRLTPNSILVEERERAGVVSGSGALMMARRTKIHSDIKDGSNSGMRNTL